MNQIQIFNDPEFGDIRTLDLNGQPYFVGNDIARALGYSIPSKAINTHCKGVSKMEVPTNGGNQEMIIIPEGDVYRLVIRSQLPTAQKFESWVCDEILPSIRKSGGYINNQEKMSDAEILANAIVVANNIIKQEQLKRQELEIQNSKLLVDNQIMTPKAEFFDELVDRNLLTNFRDTAKELQIKEKDFITFLIDKKFIYRDNKNKLSPYAKKNNGLFEVKECFNKSTEWVGTQTLITPKGRETFRLLLK